MSIILISRGFDVIHSQFDPQKTVALIYVQHPLSKAMPADQINIPRKKIFENEPHHAR